MTEKTNSGFYLEGAPYWYDIGPLPDDIPFPIPSDYIGVSLRCPVDVYVERAKKRENRLNSLISVFNPPSVDYYRSSVSRLEVSIWVSLSLFFSLWMVVSISLISLFINLVFVSIYILRVQKVIVYFIHLARFRAASALLPYLHQSPQSESVNL
jgi:hypothetical protein